MKKEDLVVGVRLSNLATRGKVSAIGNFYFLLQLEGGEEIKVSKSMLTDYDIIQDTKYVSPALYKLNNGHFYVSSELFENVEDASSNMGKTVEEQEKIAEQKNDEISNRTESTTTEIIENTTNTEKDENKADSEKKENTVKTICIYYKT